MVSVEEKVLRILCWSNLDFLNKKHSSSESIIQMFYEFRIFSTIYVAKEMPSFFKYRIVVPSISFTIPSSSLSSPNKLLTGINFCSLHTWRTVDQTPSSVDDQFPTWPMVTISNITKNSMWIYKRYIDRYSLNQECRAMLRHLMFGMNEMEADDHISITVTEPLYESVKECG
ncbi:unnamed protein product [Lactuca saligna]|uniref:Uncharacterized protein n=1 Tax=Lactuca saligna TaxID=75948 RepID=A0AA35VWA8_LACSI|nr:unnamed protein product [Lactuca saligna]